MTGPALEGIYEEHDTEQFDSLSRTDEKSGTESVLTSVPAADMMQLSLLDDTMMNTSLVGPMLDEVQDQDSLRSDSRSLPVEQGGVHADPMLASVESWSQLDANDPFSQDAPQASDGEGMSLSLSSMLYASITSTDAADTQAVKQASVGDTLSECTDCFGNTEPSNIRLQTLRTSQSNDECDETCFCSAKGSNMCTSTDDPDLATPRAEQSIQAKFEAASRVATNGQRTQEQVSQKSDETPEVTQREVAREVTREVAHESAQPSRKVQQKRTSQESVASLLAPDLYTDETTVRKVTRVKEEVKVATFTTQTDTGRAAASRGQKEESARVSSGSSTSSSSEKGARGHASPRFERFAQTVERKETIRTRFTNSTFNYVARMSAHVHPETCMSWTASDITRVTSLERPPLERSPSMSSGVRSPDSLDSVDLADLDDCYCIKHD